MRDVRLLCATVLGAVALFVMAACGGDDSTAGPERSESDGSDGEDTNIQAETDAEPEYGGRIIYGLNAESSGWDPSATEWAFSTYIVGNAIFDRLMAYDEDQQVGPFLAESMEPNEDFTSWTITLRPDVVFHDGEPFDAEALKANLELHQNSFLTGAALAPVAEVEVEDELTVRVDMSMPWATFPHLLTAQPGYVVSPASIEAGEEARSRNPVGTGPFEFVRWEDGRLLEVVRNDNYWREGYPYLDGMEFRPLPDNTARTAALLSGDIDMLETGDPRQLLRLTEEADAGRIQLYIDREGETNETFVALNTSEPPFDNPLARQAVAHAIDTQSISEVVYNGVFPPARGLFKETSPWYTETDYPSYDPERARQLAAEYEQETGESLQFSANITPQPEIVEVAQLVQAQLGEVGIDAQIDTMEQAVLLIRALSGDYQATGFVLFGSAHPDRDYVFLHGDNADGDVALAFTRNANDTLSEALDAARATDDLDEQVAAYATVQEEMASDLSIVWLVHNESGTAAENRVRDIKNWTLPDGTPGSRSEGVVTQSYQLWIETDG